MFMNVRTKIPAVASLLGERKRQAERKQSWHFELVRAEEEEEEEEVEEEEEQTIQQ